MAEKMTPGLRALFGLETGADDWIVREVEAFLGREQDRRMDPGWFHASSIDHPCDAYLAFEFLGLTSKQRLDPRLQRIFDNGNGRDEYWKGYLGRSGLSICEQRIRTCEGCGLEDKEGRHVCIPEIRLRGSVDDIVRHPKSGAITLFEFKTKNSNLWNKLTKPDRAHVFQMHVYMRALNLSDGHIVYECKDDQKLKEFVVPFDNDFYLAQIHNRLANILESLRNGWSPTKTPQSNEEQCPHYGRCTTFDFSQAVG